MTHPCAKRIQRDIANILSNPPEDIFAEPNNDDMRFMHVLIMGPKDTPYQGGMFLFQVEFIDDYPIKPPKVLLLTTGHNTVRFHPSFYVCGKVCLSLLGTLAGPDWSPAITLSTLMVAVQSVMNEIPYNSIPRCQFVTGTKVDLYTETVQHETIRIAAIDVYEKRNSYPKTLIGEIEKAFKMNYDFYVEVCKKNIEKDGQPLYDPYDDNKGTCCYKKLLEKLESMKPEV